MNISPINTIQNPDNIKSNQEVLAGREGEALQSQMAQYLPLLEEKLGSASEAKNILDNITAETIKSATDEDKVNLDKLVESANEKLNEYLTTKVDKRIKLQNYIEKVNVEMITKLSEQSMNDLATHSVSPIEEIKDAYNQQAHHVYKEFVANGVITKYGQTKNANEKKYIRKEIADTVMKDLESRFNDQEHRKTTEEQEKNTAEYKIEKAYIQMVGHEMSESQKKIVQGVINRYFDANDIRGVDGNYSVDINTMWQTSLVELGYYANSAALPSIEELLEKAEAEATPQNLQQNQEPKELENQ